MFPFNFTVWAESKLNASPYFKCWNIYVKILTGLDIFIKDCKYV